MPGQPKAEFTPAASRALIGTGGLVALTFFTVSGGAYGLEPVVGSVGGRAALLLLALVPLLWSLPIALMAAELTAALPLLGGYYQWVRRAMGEFWGFQEGWWSWLFTWVDMPLYPLLCGAILQQAWPSLSGGHALSRPAMLAFVMAFIWAAALLNWLGVKPVTEWAIVATIGVLAPFLAFLAAAWREPPRPAPAHPHPLAWTGWALGLSTVMWNYAGWDNLATFAPSVRQPGRSYPRALLASVALVILAYVAPVAAGLRLDPHRSHWRNGYFVHLAAIALGPWAAAVMFWTALAAAWSQYTSQLLYVIPLPVSMAQDGYLPKLLTRSNRRGVATPALWLCTALFSFFALISFSNLVVADVMLYSAALALEFAALLALRRRQPHLPRPFRVPLRGRALAAFSLVPLGLAAIATLLAITQDRLAALGALALLASGPLLLPMLRRRPAAAAATRSAP